MGQTITLDMYLFLGIFLTGVICLGGLLFLGLVHLAAFLGPLLRRGK